MGRCVLVSDDDEPVRERMRQTLAAWGCATMVAADAGDAVALCRAWLPDALVVDFRLPDNRDGLDAIATVRAALDRAIPALVVSSERTSEQIARAHNAGFTLLRKPVAPAKLRAALSYLPTCVTRSALRASRSELLTFTSSSPGRTWRNRP